MRYKELLKEVLEDTKKDFITNKKTGVVHEFLGYIKGIEIIEKDLYDSTEYMVYLLEKEGIRVPKDLIQTYADCLSISKFKDNFYDLSIIENETYDAIFLEDFNFKSSHRAMQPFFDEFKVFLDEIKEIKELRNKELNR